LLGLNSLSIDSTPVAAAITAAKLVSVSAEEVVKEARAILAVERDEDVPRSVFWQKAYKRSVLVSICRLRAELARDCSTSARVALRAVVLGALHGPRTKTSPSYLSNQSPRTYAPKPRYAVAFWRRHGLVPPDVDVIDVVARRAQRYFAVAGSRVRGRVVMGDSRLRSTFDRWQRRHRFDFVVTSPPYYGMRTYVPDQWLRNWFVGGPDYVDYSAANQLDHASPDEFARELSLVWTNCARVCSESAQLVVRFGAIRDRRVDPTLLIKESLKTSNWGITTVRSAGSASHGKRQSDAFLKRAGESIEEVDIWARLG
jgi:hypothetical protein